MLLFLQLFKVTFVKARFYSQAKTSLAAEQSGEGRGLLSIVTFLNLKRRVL